MCKGGGGGGGTNTVISNQQPDPQIKQAYLDLVNRAGNVANTPLSQYTGNLIAGFTPQQNQSFQEIGQAQGLAQPYLDAASQYAGIGAAPVFQNVQQFNGQNVAGYLNPYINQVINPTLQRMQQDFGQQNQQFIGQAIGAGAFGGDRAGVAAANLSGQQNLALGQTAGGLYNQAYQQALGELNAQQGLQLQGLNTDAARAGQAAFSLGFLGPAAQNSLLSGAGALQQAGGLQQQLAQERLNLPFEFFTQQQGYPFQTTNFLGGITEGIGNAAGSTGTTTAPGPSTLSQLGGLGLTGLGLAGEFGAFGGGSTAALGATLSGIETQSALDAASGIGFGLGVGDLAAFGGKSGGRIHRQDGGDVPAPPPVSLPVIPGRSLSGYQGYFRGDYGSPLSVYFGGPRGATAQGVAGLGPSNADQSPIPDPNAGQRQGYQAGGISTPSTSVAYPSTGTPQPISFANQPGFPSYSEYASLRSGSPGVDYGGNFGNVGNFAPPGLARQGGLGSYPSAASFLPSPGYGVPIPQFSGLGGGFGQGASLPTVPGSGVGGQGLSIEPTASFGVSDPTNLPHVTIPGTGAPVPVAAAPVPAPAAPAFTLADALADAQIGRSPTNEQFAQLSADDQGAFLDFQRQQIGGGGKSGGRIHRQAGGGLGDYESAFGIPENDPSLEASLDAATEHKGLSGLNVPVTGSGALQGLSHLAGSGSPAEVRDEVLGADHPDKDPPPVVDHSGDSVNVRYPDGSSLDTGLPSDRSFANRVTSSPYYPLLTAGLGMLASRSPFASVALGEGGLRALQALQQQRHEDTLQGRYAAEQAYRDALLRQGSRRTDLAEQANKSLEGYRQEEIDYRNKQAATAASRAKTEDEYHKQLLGIERQRLGLGNLELLPGKGPDEKGNVVTGAYSFDRHTGARTFLPGVDLTGKTADEITTKDREGLASKQAAADLNHVGPSGTAKTPAEALDQWRKYYGLPSTAPTSPSAAAPTAGAPATAIPAAPQGVPPTAQYSPSTHSWWWQQNGAWQSKAAQ